MKTHRFTPRHGYVRLIRLVSCLTSQLKPKTDLSRLIQGTGRSAISFARRCEFLCVPAEHVYSWSVIDFGRQQHVYSIIRGRHIQGEIVINTLTPLE